MRLIPFTLSFWHVSNLLHSTIGSTKLNFQQVLEKQGSPEFPCIAHVYNGVYYFVTMNRIPRQSLAYQGRSVQVSEKVSYQGRSTAVGSLHGAHMNTKRVTFPNVHGELIAARMELPEDERPLAYALFAHCFTCSKDLKAVVNISRALSSRRIAVLRFDFTGLGESEGDFSATSFSSEVSDLVEAARFLEREYEAPKLLIGSFPGRCCRTCRRFKYSYDDCNSHHRSSL